MSEENKDPEDKAEGAFDKAKGKAKKTAKEAKEKAKEFAEEAKESAEEAKEKAKEFAEEAKESASEFAEEAKKATNEFKENAKRTFSEENPDSGRNVAIISHLTIIGWIIALIMNSNNKTLLGSFYIRQTLGIYILGLIISWIPFVNFIGWIFVFILWLISLIGAFNISDKPVLLIGEFFQDWFKSL
ncbi:MAG: YtxH domain-containing protein [Eudoraea sp.]|uniref:YtxH domain-containing protein n=1 Tax=Eudoraea sp. TaxID=1979955 RepID=UPI003C716DCD